MSNMSYCRWENTAIDLSDCVLHLDDVTDSETGEINLSKTERRGLDKVVELAREIVEWADSREGVEEDEDGQ